MAKVVNPNNATHKISFLPRYSFTSLELFLTNESEVSATEVAVPISATEEVRNGIIEIDFDYTFSERDKFSIRIAEGDNVIYRGKLFATEQATQDFKITDGFITY